MTTSILDYLDKQGRHTNKAVWGMINSPTMTITEALLSIGARGHKHVQKDSAQSQGVHSVVLQYTKFFEYAQAMDGNFSITDWLDEGKGFIYLTNYDAIKDVLKPGLSLFLDLLGKKVLSRQENLSGKRLWIFLDELGSLHKLGTLVDVLTRAGSKGVCVVLSTQDRGQIENVYGRNLTDSILNSCNSWAALRVTDPATAKVLVDRVGEWKFIEAEESYSDKFDDGGDSLSIANRIRREKLLLDSQIMGQQPLEAYIHIDGFPYAQVKIEKRFFDAKQPAFLPRTDVDLERSAAEYAEIQFAANLTKNHSLGEKKIGQMEEANGVEEVEAMQAIEPLIDESAQITW